MLVKVLSSCSRCSGQPVWPVRWTVCLFCTLTHCKVSHSLARQCLWMWQPIKGPRTCIAATTVADTKGKWAWTCSNQHCGLYAVKFWFWNNNKKKDLRRRFRAFLKTKQNNSPLSLLHVLMRTVSPCFKPLHGPARNSMFCQKYFNKIAYWAKCILN